jgi:prolipoprotein diacylglyceryl transferase
VDQGLRETTAVLAFIPSPSHNGFFAGPLFVHFYGLCDVVGISAAILPTRRLWRARGGDPDLVDTVALWGVPAGILGGRLYHDITSWNEVPHNWWGRLAIWEGGLGIWGGIAAGAVAGIVVLRPRGVSVAAFMDAAAPGLLVAQAIGRVGNYFNQELFGGPTSLPWGLEIGLAHRPARGGRSCGDFDREAERHPVVDAAAVVEDRLGWIAACEQRSDQVGCRGALGAVAEEDGGGAGVE